MKVTLPPPHGPTLLDFSMIHPHCPTYDVAASQTRGAAAALRDRSKYRARAGLLHPRHTSVPSSVETYGHLGGLIMLYLRTLSDIASAGVAAVIRGSLIACAHREVSATLVQSQGYVYCFCTPMLAKAQVLPGADTSFPARTFCCLYGAWLLAVTCFFSSGLVLCQMLSGQ
jgi:hypothetical protein